MRQGRRTAVWCWVAVGSVACPVGMVSAQNAGPVEPSAVPGDPQPEGPAAATNLPADEHGEPAIVPRMDKAGGEADRPAVDALPKPWVQMRESRVGMPAASVDLDPAVIGPMPGQPAPKLYREGDFVVDRLGRLRELPNGATAFVLVDEARDSEAASAEDADALMPDAPGARAMVLQPCQRLETMISAADQQEDRDALFRLSGQVHVYRGVNYLMPTELTGYRVKADLASSAADPVAGASDLPDAAADLDSPALKEVGVQPTVDPQDPAGMMDAMAAELDALAEENPSRGGSHYGGISAPLNPQQVRTATTAQPGGRRVAGVNGGTAAGGGELVREGQFVMSRAGRVVRSSGAREVLFAFESDGPELAEAPMGILPCRLRVFMEDTVSRRGDSVVFVVSGRVTQFRGANYLLPSVVKLRLDSDELGG